MPESITPPSLTDLNPNGFSVTVEIVADGAGQILERHVKAVGFVLDPVYLRRDLVSYIEELAKGHEIPALNQ